MKKPGKLHKWQRRIKWAVPTGFILIAAIIVAANYVVEYNTEEFVYKDLTAIPYNKAGLLLGTSKTLKSGLPNQYFLNRIGAAIALFESGKIDVIVISGDNSTKDIMNLRI